ncbi:Gp15 family bacteriophage protein [Oceanobacillus kimchii]|uniref:Gp15 family bacteriophage protein n=1 Tax=Oceanobacillus kimchii TaxID=746691 RepID=UPI000369F4D6|nr:Gp15 family bacteriophage protein [Oceanobacillus kimchii]
MFLTESLKDTCIYKGIVLQLNVTFDNIILFIEMTKDEGLEDYEKVLIGLEMLITNYEELEYLPSDEKYQIFMMILKEELSFKRDNEFQTEQATEENLENEPPSKKEEYDFDVDGERIYASFLMDYGIDLLEQQGKMHWKKFISLFSGLSEKTPFMQVVQIRAMEVPAPTKNNQKERNKILRLKRKYALENSEKTADEAFEDMITAFGGKAGDK